MFASCGFLSACNPLESPLHPGSAAPFLQREINPVFRIFQHLQTSFPAAPRGPTADTLASQAPPLPQSAHIFSFQSPLSEVKKSYEVQYLPFVPSALGVVLPTKYQSTGQIILKRTREYFRIWGPQSLCLSSSTLPPIDERSHGKCAEEQGWLCSIKLYLQKQTFPEGYNSLPLAV